MVSMRISASILFLWCQPRMLTNFKGTPKRVFLENGRPFGLWCMLALDFIFSRFLRHLFFSCYRLQIEAMFCLRSKTYLALSPISFGTSVKSFRNGRLGGLRDTPSIPLRSLS